MIKALAVQAITSETATKIGRFVSYLKGDRSDTIEFYHSVGDVHSLAALYGLKTILSYDSPSSIRCRIYLLPDAKAAGLAAYETNLETQHAWAIKDVGYLFKEYGFPSLGSEIDKNLQIPSETIKLMGNRSVVSILEKIEYIVSTPEQVDLLINISRLVLKNDQTELEKITEQVSEEKVKEILNEGLYRINKKGHYLTGVFRYGYEFFWGLDRLGYLEKQFFDESKCKFNRTNNSKLKFYAEHPSINNEKDEVVLQGNQTPSLPSLIPMSESNPTLPDLEMFWSFRSPYSQIVLRSVFDMCDHYKIKLVIRPVLPMVMRGLAVPLQKQLYIITDAAREARSLNQTFGRLYDPVGLAVEKAFAIYTYVAVPEKKEREFLLSWALGVWGEGTNATTEDGIRYICERAGLSR